MRDLTDSFWANCLDAHRSAANGALKDAGHLDMYCPNSDRDFAKVGRRCYTPTALIARCG